MALVEVAAAAAVVGAEGRVDQEEREGLVLGGDGIDMKYMKRFVSTCFAPSVRIVPSVPDGTLFDLP